MIMLGVCQNCDQQDEYPAAGNYGISCQKVQTFFDSESIQSLNLRLKYIDAAKLRYFSIAVHAGRYTLRCCVIDKLRKKFMKWNF